MENRMIFQKVNNETIQAVWGKGTVIPGYDPNLYRQDQCTAWIKREKYGNRNSILGWEIHHDNPNGPDDILNYSPLQWENNAKTSDGRLTCPVHSNCNRNEHI